jgi:hypothetical protein
MVSQENRLVQIASITEHPIGTGPFKWTMPPSGMKLSCIASTAPAASGQAPGVRLRRFVPDSPLEGSGFEL